VADAVYVQFVCRIRQLCMETEFCFATDYIHCNIHWVTLTFDFAKLFAELKFGLSTYLSQKVE